MPYPSYPDEYRQKFYEDGHYKSIYFVESMNNVEIVPGGDLKVNPVEDPLRPGNKTIVFTEEQLIREKFTYKEYLNSANNICVGSCECNSIEFTIRNNGVVPPLFYNTGTEQVERTFKVYVYFDHDSSTVIPLGMFRVTEDTLSGDKKERNITMYDYMATLRDLDAYDWYQNFKKAHPNGSTLKVFRDSFWDFMQNPDPTKGIKFPVTQKTQTLINDNVKIAYTLDEDTILLSAGNIIEDLCEINGVWGRFSRDVDSQNRSIFEYVEIPHITSKTKITKWRSIEPFQRDMYITHDWYQTKPIHAVTIRNAYDANIAQYASAELETRDNEGNVTGRFGNYAIYDNKFIDEIKSSADNTENDTDPEDDPITYVTGFEYLKKVCKNVLSKIKYVKYTPYELTTVGDLARTCGDIIYVNGTGEDDVIEELQDYTHFFSYVFERELKGIQNMRDTYRAKGDRVLPMFGDSSTSSGYTSSGGGGAYAVQSSGITGGTGIAENVNTTGKADGVPLEYWPELIRNVGLRVPDSPKGKVVFDKATGAATITWTDPADYDDNKPIPSVWEKTYLLRSYKGRPWNIYDPSIEVLVTETVKDTYKTNGFVDSTAGQHDKVFYAIFPQNTAGYVNPFTVLSIKPDRTMEAPEITDVKNPTPHSVTVDHTIPDQTSTYSKKVVVANPDHEPLDATDGIATVITNFASTVVSGLEKNRDYYFKVFLVKASGAESESDYDEGKTLLPDTNYIYRIEPFEYSEGNWMVADTAVVKDPWRNPAFADTPYWHLAMQNTYDPSDCEFLIDDTDPENICFYPDPTNQNSYFTIDGLGAYGKKAYYPGGERSGGDWFVHFTIDFKMDSGDYVSIPNNEAETIGIVVRGTKGTIDRESELHPFNFYLSGVPDGQGYMPISSGWYYSRWNDRWTKNYSWSNYNDGILNHYNDGNWHTIDYVLTSNWECSVGEYMPYACYVDGIRINYGADYTALLPPPLGELKADDDYITSVSFHAVPSQNGTLRFKNAGIYHDDEKAFPNISIPRLDTCGEPERNTQRLAYTIDTLSGEVDNAVIVVQEGHEPTSASDGTPYPIQYPSSLESPDTVREVTVSVEKYSPVRYYAKLFASGYAGTLESPRTVDFLVPVPQPITICDFIADPQQGFYDTTGNYRLNEDFRPNPNLSDYLVLEYDGEYYAAANVKSGWYSDRLSVEPTNWGVQHQDPFMPENIKNCQIRIDIKFAYVPHKPSGVEGEYPTPKLGIQIGQEWNNYKPLMELVPLYNYPYRDEYFPYVDIAKTNDTGEHITGQFYHEEVDVASERTDFSLDNWTYCVMRITDGKMEGLAFGCEGFFRPGHSFTLPENDRLWYPNPAYPVNLDQNYPTGLRTILLSDDMCIKELKITLHYL